MVTVLVLCALGEVIVVAAWRLATTPLDAERNWQPGFPTGEDH